MNKCLFCYDEITENEHEYHMRCCRKLFSKNVPPILDIELSQMKSIAKDIVKKRLVVTGVQPKLSLGISREHNKAGSMPRLTLIGFGDRRWADFILKPPSDQYPNLPELEDVSMHMASVCKIPTAVHGLFKLKSGELAYICRRFDRTKKGKIAVEDMCQITEVLTERKYKSSMEKVGQAIKLFSANPGNDLVTFLDLAIFSFLIGNTDMHLKNFSMITEGDISLAPAYDLLPTQLLLKDSEELALSLNGKKNKLKRSDFEIFAKGLGIPEIAIQKRFKHFQACMDPMFEVLEKSFLSKKKREELKALIIDRSKRLSAS